MGQAVAHHFDGDRIDGGRHLFLFFGRDAPGSGMHGHRRLAQRVKIADDLFVAHVLAHIVALAVNQILQRPAHTFAGRNVGMADGNDQIDHQQVGDTEDALVRLLNVDGYPLGSEAQRSDGEMDQKGGIGQPIGEVRLVAAESMRPLHRAPLAAAVAQHHDHGRRLVPIGFGFVEFQRFVRIVLHLVGRVAQVVLALLLHPKNKVGVVLRVSVAQLFFGSRIGHHDEFPGLRVGAGHGPTGDFEDLVDGIFRDRIGAELAHAHAGLHEFEQHVIGVVVASHSNPPESR